MTFVNNGFSNLKKTAAFTKHQQSDGPLHAAEAYSAWLKQVPIDQQLNEQVIMQESARKIEVYNYLYKYMNTKVLKQGYQPLFCLLPFGLNTEAQ
jgi:hypothetical protein